MPHQIIGPSVVIAINLALAIWALTSRPRDPAYRAFSMLALGLVVWNLGGVVGWWAGPDPDRSRLDRETWSHLRASWLRLSFVGALLVAPNMLHLVLACRGRRWLPHLEPGWWAVLLYAPVVALGAGVDLDFVSAGAWTNSWRRAFYDTTDAGAVAVMAVYGAYMAAAFWLGRPAAPADGAADRGEMDRLHRTIVMPWVFGTLAVLAIGAVRRDRAPTAALWTMLLSQVAMFQLGRVGRVNLRVDREWMVRFALIVIAAVSVVLVVSVLLAWLFERRVSVEGAVVLAVTLVSACYIYAAVEPGLERLAGRIAAPREKDRG